jgi:N-acetylglutamate synthase/N-acetylornithine aminotransferase
VIERGSPSNVEPDADLDPQIELDLGLGDGRAHYLTTDLSYDYVRINAEYRT